MLSVATVLLFALGVGAQDNEGHTAADFDYKPPEIVPAVDTPQPDTHQEL